RWSCCSTSRASRAGKCGRCSRSTPTPARSPATGRCARVTTCSGPRGRTERVTPNPPGVAPGGRPGERRQWLDPAVVARLAHLDVRARLVVEGFIAGMHRSPFHGFSVEFAEHRPYMPGDPLKNLDWKVLAKSDRYLIKQYTEETNLRAHPLVDLSGSM